MKISYRKLEVANFRVLVKCEAKRETKYTEMKRNQTKRNSPKRNEIYRNETDLFRFVSISFRFGKLRLDSVNFVSIYFVSFRFRFAFYRYPYFSDVSLILYQTVIIFTSFLHFTLFSVKVKTE